MHARCVFALALFGSACAGLEPLEPNVCGNGVIEYEAGEDCDLFAFEAGDRLVCPRPPDPNACRYVCQADNVIKCPLGWSCGPDGICRYASGMLEIPRETPLQLPNDGFTISDADGDGEPDLVSRLGGTISVSFSDREGGFSDAKSEVEIDRVEGRPIFVGGVVAAATELGPAVFRLAGDRRFVPKLPAETFNGADDVLAVESNLGILYLWTEGSETKGTFALQLPPQVLADVPLSELASVPSAFGDEIALAYRGKMSVAIVRADCDPMPAPCVKRRVTVPSPITTGTIFADTFLVTATEAGVAVARVGEPGSLIDPSLSALATDFPLVAGDLDGDATDDFVSRDCIYYSDAELVCGNARISAAIGDFDGDRLFEVASIDEGATFIEVRANGTISRIDLFDPARFLRAGDFDGDGFDDLVWVEDNIRVAFGGPRGLSGAGIQQAALDRVTTIAAGRLFGDDAIDDLAITWKRDDDHRAASLAGSTRRRMSAPLSIAGARGIAAGRFFDRASTDAVVFADSGLHILRAIDVPALELSPAQYIPSESLTSCFVGTPEMAIAANLGVDPMSADELIAVSAGPMPSVAILQFSPMGCVATPLGQAINDLHGLHAADIDQDGAIDLVIEATPIVVLFGDPTNALSFNSARTLPLPGEPYSAAALNADNDASFELAVLTREGVFRADYVDSSFQLAPMIELAGFGFGTIVAEDLNDDGLRDLAYSDRELVHFRILRPKNETKGVLP